MNECQELASKNLIVTVIWRTICSYQQEEAVGKTGEYPSPRSRHGCPPEVVDNKTITSVSE
jgi:hypothetical protein